MGARIALPLSTGPPSGATRPVVAVITHTYLAGVRRLVSSLRDPAQRLGFEFIVVHTGSSPETTEWLESGADAITLRVQEDRGPASSRNAVVESRPEAPAYYFFDDDVFAGAEELAAIQSLLETDATVGIAAGIPTSADGTPLATSFTRRPWANALPRVWDGWWGRRGRHGHGDVLEADVVSGSAIGVRGDLVRRVGGFETAFWPACFEDLDFAARARFAGFRILVGPFHVRQEVSATMRRTFGSRYPVLCRSSGVLFAALDYPVAFAAARMMRAIVSVLSGPPPERAADAHGLLRCAQRWRLILRGRSVRRALRRARARGRGRGAATGSALARMRGPVVPPRW